MIRDRQIRKVAKLYRDLAGALDDERMTIFAMAAAVETGSDCAFRRAQSRAFRAQSAVNLIRIQLMNLSCDTCGRHGPLQTVYYFRGAPPTRFCGRHADLEQPGRDR